jgi:hypothetical protein
VLIAGKLTRDAFDDALDDVLMDHRLKHKRRYRFTMFDQGAPLAARTPIPVENEQLHTSFSAQSELRDAHASPENFVSLREMRSTWRAGRHGHAHLRFDLVWRGCASSLVEAAKDRSSARSWSWLKAEVDLWSRPRQTNG